MSEGARKNPVVVSVINLKGGVGKTTVAALLARYAAGMSLSVLAVDLDPQANLSQALMTEYDYKQFMDNESFKRWMADTVFGLAYDGPAQ